MGCVAQGLGIGRTRHGEPVKEGAVGRKGISVERTFAAISSWADLEARVCPLHQSGTCDCREGNGGGRVACTSLWALHAQHTPCCWPVKLRA